MTRPGLDPLARFLDALAARGAHGRAVHEALALADLAALAGAMAARDALGADLDEAARALADAPAPARAAALAAAEAAVRDDAALEARLAAGRDGVARELAQLDAGEAAADAYQGRPVSQAFDVTG